jgi:hypothetical protein
MNARMNQQATHDLCSAEEVIEGFCGLTGLKRDDLANPTCRTHLITRARYELFWLLRDLTVLSQSEIGELCNRHQTVVMEGARVTADKIATDDDYRAHVQRARAYIIQNRNRKAENADAARALARKLLRLDGSEPSETQRLAITVVSVAAILRSTDLTDAEARLAAITVIQNGGGQAHG